MLSPRMPSLAALQMLVTVQQLGSLSAAGDLLGLTQQAVSSRMRALETQVGAPLLIRSPRGSSLSETGALVAGWAMDVLAAAERFDAGIASVRSDSDRELTVAASQTIAEHLLPQWLVALRQQQEDFGRLPTSVRLRVTNSAEAAEMVRLGTAVLGFIESPHLPAGLRAQTVQFDDLVLVAAPQHPWASRHTPVTPNALAGTPLVSRERGSGTRDALEVLLIAHEMVAAAIELSTTAAVRTAIAAGVAPGVLSSLAVRDDLLLHRLVAIPVCDLSLKRPLRAIWHSGRTPPAGAARDLVTIASRQQN